MDIEHRPSNERGKDDSLSKKTIHFIQRGGGNQGFGKQFVKLISQEQNSMPLLCLNKEKQGNGSQGHSAMSQQE